MELGQVIGLTARGIFQLVRYANGHQEELEDHEVLESIALCESGPILHQVQADSLVLTWCPSVPQQMQLEQVESTALYTPDLLHL